MDIPVDVQAEIDIEEARLKELRYDRQFIGDFKARDHHDGCIERCGDYIRHLKMPYMPYMPSKVSTFKQSFRTSDATKANRAAAVARAIKQLEDIDNKHRKQLD